MRGQFHFHGTGELVNTVTGKTETGSSPIMLIHDYQAGTLVRVGLVFTTTSPDRGLSP